MSESEPTEALVPFLNPEYWEGHSIGYGQPKDEWPNVSMFGRDSRQSKRALRDRIALMEKAVPVESYNDGQTFDAEAYDPGTLALFREESLYGSTYKLELDVEDLKEEPLPARPYDVSPSFGQTSTTESIRTGQFAYITQAKWGIVSVSKGQTKLLRCTSTGLVDKLGEGRVSIISLGLSAQKSPFEIGRTRHYLSRRYNLEWIHRINVLDVVAYGEEEKEKIKLGRFASKLAFGNSNS